MYFVNYNFRCASFPYVFERCESPCEYLSNGIGMTANGQDLGEIWDFEVRMLCSSSSGNCRKGAKRDLRSCAAIRGFVRLFRNSVRRSMYTIPT